ncbi:MAG: ATP-dependent RNA helicase [SAR86 cluster bacterium]|uniref:ATP-dependent RNA helicase DeaD n=1 Tax=SAR86 cluster bacterium TaxID=2030880 RepID=A0A2A4XDL9_9GAMM|nr:MAG: ATP-dependent RNA helicase [SAR86 cluster bacterium]
MSSEEITSFEQMALTKPLLKSLIDVGYETPSPIQAQTIPLLLEGRDVLGQAQTGTGKTAAFALPILSKLDLKQKDPQVLVLAPTRELAIQVAEAFQKYATHIKGFHVLPVYGGQDYSGQIRALKRGVHVVVGTPGRVMDHMRRGTLKLNQLSTLVLDEADEMLRMGFIDDVEWILEQTPSERQIALFSATMPTQIRRIATKYLNDPVQVTVKMKTATAESIRQRFWPVSGMHKLDALTRILEAETFDAMLIFVRTRILTVDLAEKLSARGFSATALNGDIAQKTRERTIERLKKGQLDILVATDVAARGLDVDRISHVVNYDIPHDTESYIHRIGRTGRAGREGDAILFVAPREKRMLAAIERATNKKIEMMELPSTQLINDKRIEQFKQSISETIANEDLSQYTKLLEKFEAENEFPMLGIAAALAKLSQGGTPLLLQNKPMRKSEKFKREDEGDSRGRSRSRPPTGERSHRSESRSRPPTDDNRHRSESRSRPTRADSPPEKGMERFRLEVGHNHDVMPGNIVGAIANEAGLDAQHIGRINIFDDHSTVDLPDDMPDEIFKELKNVWVSGQTLKISRLTMDGKSSRPAPPAFEKPSKGPKKDKKPKRKPTSKGKSNAKSKDDPKKKAAAKKKSRHRNRVGTGK